MCFKSKTKPVEPATIPAGSASSLPKREAIKGISTSNFQTNTYQAPVAPAKPFTGVAPLNNSFNSSGIAGSAMYGGGNTFNSNLSGNQPLRSPKATISYAAQDYDSSPLTNQNGFISTKRVTHFVQDRGDRPEDYAY